MKVLMRVSHSERPLNANELCGALGVEIGFTDRDSQNVPAIKTLLECSLGLVIVEASTCAVRPAHSSPVSGVISSRPSSINTISSLPFSAAHERGVRPSLSDILSFQKHLHDGSVLMFIHPRQGGSTVFIQSLE